VKHSLPQLRERGHLLCPGRPCPGALRARRPGRGLPAILQIPTSYLFHGEGDSRYFGPASLLFLNWCRERFADAGTSFSQALSW